MPTIIDGTLGLTTPTYGGADTSEYLVPVTQFKNRIINGAMQIDQRNAGASVTPNSSYTLDRWAVYNTQTSKLTVQQNAASVTPPAGFSNYLGVTSSSAYSVTSSDFFALRQGIEGFNTADLNIGTANAKTVTLSFWVRSSLTGTFGGALQNSANDRNYLFSYSISSANTWEQKSVTIALDQTGTWIGATNGAGLFVAFGLGAGSTYSGTANTWQAGQLFQPNSTVSVVGTNGATFYITGVQLEVGSTATSFDYRPYGTELALCQRYYQQYYLRSLYINGSSYIGGGYPTQVPMRAAPTISFTDLAGTANRVTIGGVNNYAIAAGGISGYVFNTNTTGVLVDAIITSPPAGSTWWAVNATVSIEL